MDYLSWSGLRKIYEKHNRKFEQLSSTSAPTEVQLELEFFAVKCQNAKAHKMSLAQLSFFDALLSLSIL